MGKTLDLTPRIQERRDRDRGFNEYGWILGTAVGDAGWEITQAVVWSTESLTTEERIRLLRECARDFENVARRWEGNAR
jgi:hypothetical protein